MDTIQIFIEILDNSKNIPKEIRGEVLKSLNVSDYEPLREFVMESLEQFNFNLVERKFLSSIENLVTEEVNRLIQTNNHEIFILNLTEGIKKSKPQNFFIEDDFKNLAKNINNKFPLLASDEWYLKFISKKEQIINVINNYNNVIVDTLVKLVPQLSSELQMKKEVSENSQASINSSVNQSSKLQTELSLDDFVARCTEKLNEVDIMFKNGGNFKSEIAKCFRQLKGFTENLNNEVYAQKILNEYTKLNAVAQTMIYDEIIFQNVPMLKEVYEKYDQLLVIDDAKKDNEPKFPNTPTPSLDSYVGMSSEEIRMLIKQNKYFSVLQAINKDDFKYSNFINTGFQVIMNEFYEKAKQCTTYEEKKDAYFELYEIYQNFRDYISLEASSQVRELLDDMQNYLQSVKGNSDIGIRYNSEEKEQKASSMRR